MHGNMNVNNVHTCTQTYYLQIRRFPRSYKLCDQVSTMLHGIHLFLEVSFLSIIPKHLFHPHPRLKTPSGSWAAMKREFTTSLVIRNNLECISGDQATLGRQPILLLMRKLKRLFVNGCEYNSHISIATKFLNPCQHETNTSVCSGSWRKNYVSSLKEISYMQRWSDCSCNFSHLGQPHPCEIPCPQAHIYQVLDDGHSFEDMSVLIWAVREADVIHEPNVCSLIRNWIDSPRQKEAPVRDCRKYSR
jgi:hypothetical protein